MNLIKITWEYNTIFAPFEQMNTIHYVEGLLLSMDMFIGKRAFSKTQFEEFLKNVEMKKLK